MRLFGLVRHRGFLGKLNGVRLLPALFDVEQTPRD
jgi:hypothetical protein